MSTAWDSQSTDWSTALENVGGCVRRPRFESYLGWVPSAVGFPGGSACKESACNAGYPGSIPGSGRSPGKGIDYLLQYFGDSFVAQLVKTLPEMQENPVRFLGHKDPLEKG